MRKKGMSKRSKEQRTEKRENEGAQKAEAKNMRREPVEMSKEPMKEPGMESIKRKK